ncbi:hypothetical protein K445DRAFT_299230 [Daldinia sp. EC12]|nr:hypothetical protein K445DRAFT_299230 [Daldinia sp. EC12]
MTVSTSNLTENLSRPVKKGQHYRPNHSSDFALERPRYDITDPDTRLYNLSAVDDLISPSNYGPSPSAIQFIPNTPQYIPIASRASSASTFSQDSYPATEAKKRQSACELFEQHGIRRPPGWFSDDEDLSLLGDRTAGPRRFCRICHVCSTRTWSQTHCLSCRHRLCEKCLCEVPTSTEKEHKAFSHNHSHAARQDRTQYTKPTLSTPETVQLSRKVSRLSSRTSNSRSAQRTDLHQPSHTHDQGYSATKLQPETSTNVDNKSAQPVAVAKGYTASERLDSPRGSLSMRSVKQNPFIVGDKERVKSTAESCVPESLGVRHYHCQRSAMKLGDTGPEVPDIHVECDNPMCRATHAGHYPYRHSITCALHRSEEFERSGGSTRGLSRPNKPSVANPANPQSKKDTLQSPEDTIRRRHLTGPQASYHVAEHINNGASHGTRHLHNSRAGKVVDEAGYGVGGQSREFRSTETECASYADREHDVADGYVVKDDETPRRTHTSDTAKQIQRGIQSRSFLPKSRVFSPPPWLQAPRKEAGDAKSRLHHIDIGNHGRSLHVSVMSSEGERVNHPQTLAYETNVERTENRQVSSHHRCRPIRQQEVEDIKYSRSTCRSPPPACPDISRLQQNLESSKRSYSFVHEESRIKSAHTENSPIYPRNDARTVRENGRSPLSATTRASHSPLQPRRISRGGIDERAAFRSRSAVLEPEGRKSSITVTGATSEFELHRPNPIAPPNHDCSWKDRYLALTAEIRLLKAELSTRASLRGPEVGYTGREDSHAVNEEDDGLGIEGITIVMHLKGRDDLVINTDLTQAAE